MFWAPRLPPWIAPLWDCWYIPFDDPLGGVFFWAGSTHLFVRPVSVEHCRGPATNSTSDWTGFNSPWAAQRPTVHVAQKDQCPETGRSKTSQWVAGSSNYWNAQCRPVSGLFWGSAMFCLTWPFWMKNRQTCVAVGRTSREKAHDRRGLASIGWCETK